MSWGDHAGGHRILVEYGSVSRQAGDAFLYAGASRIVQPDDGCAALQGQSLHFYDFGCVGLAQRTAVYGEVVSVNEHLPSVYLCRDRTPRRLPESVSCPFRSGCNGGSRICLFRRTCLCRATCRCVRVPSCGPRRVAFSILSGPPPSKPVCPIPQTGHIVLLFSCFLYEF